MANDVTLPVQVAITSAERAAHAPRVRRSGMNDVVLPIEIHLPRTPELERLLRQGGQVQLTLK